ncbi:MAG TPA: UvrB/UvrC motif-containing protein [Phycisphaerales bacterium]|nr:UvrB/UvrC motif-containing protein [Phycisphaerales bacterium]
MNVDLTQLLNDWPYEPGKINVRLIQGEDGEQKVQVRLDLGVLQMNIDGRPDGHTPHGYDNLLEYYEARLDEASGGEDPEERGEPGGGEPAGAAEAEAPQEAPAFVLTPEDCRALREEAVQYYHRYVALLVLEDYDRVVRDTTRNLRLLDLCAEHAQAEDDRTVLEQFRPYITMMRARALASQALRDNEPKAALHAIDEGIESLRRYFADNDATDMFESSNEVQMLRGMRESLVPRLPVSQKSELRQRLQRAIEAENYELAAILRDELKMLPE